MSKEDIDHVIVKAIQDAEIAGLIGSANTPFILKRIRELSDGLSVSANRALIEDNVVKATEIAKLVASYSIQKR